MIELIIKKDDREINRYFLPQGVTTLGRAEDNTIILDDSCVSRRHARIKVEGGKVSIEDLGSGNGTFFGESRIEREDLSDGDEVVIEPFRLLLRKDANPQKVVDSTRPVPTSGMIASDRLNASERIESSRREPGGAAAGGPRLEVVRGEGGPYLLTSDEEMTIGRSDEARITLKDPSSSRKHSAIEKMAKGWVLKDLGSANGTYVNGAPIKDTLLRDGDIMLIGNTELRFVDPSAHEAVQQPVTPPPKTAPVKSNRRPAPPPRETEDRNTAFEQHGGSMGGEGMEMEMSAPDRRSRASMPQEGPSIGGTDVGGAPPPAWSNSTNLDATGEGEPLNGGNGGFDDAGDNFNMTGDGGGYEGGDYGVELGDDSLFPGGERPPESLVGKFILSFKSNRSTQLFTLLIVGGFFVFLFVARNGQKNQLPPSGFVNTMDSHQQMTYQTMVTFGNEAKTSLEKQEFGGAFERYGKILKFSDEGGMDRVAPAQVLKGEASYDITALHEYLVLRKIQGDTKSLGINAKELADRIKKDTAQGRDAMARGPRITNKQAAQGVWGSAISAWRDLLTIDPGNAEAKQNLPIAENEFRKMGGAIAADSKEALDNLCKQQMARADQLAARGDAKSIQAAIVEYGKLDQIDTNGQTNYPTAARIRIASLKKKLTEMASALRQTALSQKEKQDWRNARKSIRQAMAINPYDPGLNEIYDIVERECLRSADASLQEAKVYFGAEDYKNASASANLALTYSDLETDRQYKAAREILKKIQRAGEDNGHH